jgi:sterol desaturase/sphingolipid hydroxylase (fatty acid hydroxylase superfamily)
MIRNLLVAIFFFFGPALLMFMLRNVFLLLRIWRVARQKKSQEPEVIDITPVKPQTPMWFYIAAGVLGLASAISVFLYLQSIDDMLPQHYVPAYTDDSGQVVPGRWQPTEPENR